MPRFICWAVGRRHVLHGSCRVLSGQAEAYLKEVWISAGSLAGCSHEEPGMRGFLGLSAVHFLV